MKITEDKEARCHIVRMYARG